MDLPPRAMINLPIPRLSIMVGGLLGSSSANLIISLILILFNPSVSAQTSNATCDRTTRTSWLFNADDESPCVAWSKLQSLCLPQSRYVNVPPLENEGWAYNAPEGGGDLCQCNVVAYALMAGCSWYVFQTEWSQPECQIGDAESWPTEEAWRSGCSEYNNTSVSFAQSVLPLPAYAFLPLPSAPFPSASVQWSAAHASDQAASAPAATVVPTIASTTLSRSFPPLTNRPSSTPTTTSTSEDPSSPTTVNNEEDDQSTKGKLPEWVPIVSGVLGGIVAIILIFFLIRYWRQRANFERDTAARKAGEPKVDEPGITLPHNPIRGTTSMYDPGSPPDSMISPKNTSRGVQGNPTHPALAGAGGRMRKGWSAWSSTFLHPRKAPSPRSKVTDPESGMAGQGARGKKSGRRRRRDWTSSSEGMSISGTSFDDGTYFDSSEMEDWSMFDIELKENGQPGPRTPPIQRQQHGRAIHPFADPSSPVAAGMRYPRAGPTGSPSSTRQAGNMHHTAEGDGTESRLFIANAQPGEVPPGSTVDPRPNPYSTESRIKAGTFLAGSPRLKGWGIGGGGKSSPDSDTPANKKKDIKGKSGRKLKKGKKKATIKTSTLDSTGDNLSSASPRPSAPPSNPNRIGITFSSKAPQHSEAFSPTSIYTHRTSLPPDRRGPLPDLVRQPLPNPPSPYQIRDLARSTTRTAPLRVRKSAIAQTPRASVVPITPKSVVGNVDGDDYLTEFGGHGGPGRMEARQYPGSIDFSIPPPSARQFDLLHPHAQGQAQTQDQARGQDDYVPISRSGLANRIQVLSRENSLGGGSDGAGGDREGITGPDYTSQPLSPSHVSSRTKGRDKERPYSDASAFSRAPTLPSLYEPRAGAPRWEKGESMPVPPTPHAHPRPSHTRAEKV